MKSVDNYLVDPNRNDMIKIMDKSIKAYYEEINTMLGGKRLKFDRLILSDFVINNSKDRKSYINTVLQIKNEKEVIHFRKWVDEFEIKVNSGDIY